MIGSPPAFSLPVFNFFHKNNKSEPMTNRQKVRIILFWWSRGESNPCPKTLPRELLRAQTVIWIPLPRREPSHSKAW